MGRFEFASSMTPTLGVEIELTLVDTDTLALASANDWVLEQVPSHMGDFVKPELMQCYVEINSNVCSTVAEAETDIRQKLLTLEDIADKSNLKLFWSGSHPFSSWQEQRITEQERYQDLVNLLQDTARQLMTAGLHVHVGVDSGDKAVMICDRISRHLPILLAISCNSPFWEGRDTGLYSWRSKVMAGLPTAGLPPLMRNWSEYVWLVNHLIDTGYIETIREIWWDVRPHHKFGTVEVRICDVPGSFSDCLSLAAVIQCLVQYLSDEIDHGTYLDGCHPMIIGQNKWRAARYGLNAQLVDFDTYHVQPVREALHAMVEELRPLAERLDCRNYLDNVLEMTTQPTWAERQLQIYHQTRDPAEVVRRMTERSRLNHPIPPAST